MSTINMLYGSGLEGGLTAQRNYIQNPNGHKNTAGWVVYKDSFPSSLPDGIGGGSPTATFTRSTSNPLRGLASFLLTGDSQGQGVYVPFTIDPADQAKVLTISMDYSSDVTISDGMFIFYIKDVTNNTMIQPAGSQIGGIVAGGIGRAIATFQTPINSTSYRLYIHTSGVPSGTINFKIDNVVVGPQVVQNGTPVTDTATDTRFSFLGLGASPIVNVKSNRIGDTLFAEINAKITNTGSGLGAIRFTLSGIALDDSKLPADTTFDLRPVGNAWYMAAGAASYLGFVYWDANNTVFQVRSEGGSTSAWVTATSGGVPINTSVNDCVKMIVTIPIQGWSTTVQMSNDTDTRVVALRATNGLGQVISNTTWTNHTLTTVVDTHGTFSGTTYTVPVSGIYSISAQARFVANGSGDRGIRIDVNGTAISTGFFRQGGGFGDTVAANAIAQLTAGQTVTFGLYQSSGIPLSTVADATGNILNIQRLSGPSAIAASEKIIARYAGSSAATTSVGTSDTKITTMTSKVVDTHGMYSVGDNRINIPVSGIYKINAKVRLDSLNPARLFTLKVAKNGGSVSTIGEIKNPDGAVVFTGIVCGETIIECLAGDFIDIRATVDSGTTAAGSYEYSSFTVERVGN